MKKIIILLAIYIININILSAQELTVKINDNETNIGTIKIPVFGNTNNDFGSHNIEYLFELRGAFVEVVEVLGGTDFAFEETKPNFTLEEQQAGKYTLKVFSQKVKSNFEGKLFEIVLDIFPQIDFYYKNYFFIHITPTKLAIDEEEVAINAVSGIISIKNIATNQTYEEQFSHAFPNPFSYETAIFFSIKEETTLKLTIYNYIGEAIQEIPKNNNIFHYILINAEREIIDFNEQYILNKGLYKIVLRPIKPLASIGTYKLLFQTKTTNHTLNISCVK